MKSISRTNLVAASLCAAACALVALPGCGREPSRMLRQGQLPVYDFPLYMSESTRGRVWKYNSDRTRTVLVEGLNNPLGLATDRYNRLYVVEQGAGRLLRVNTSTGLYDVVATGLLNPTAVAVDSNGEAFVAQETPHNVIRASSSQVISDSFTRPWAMTIGVNDVMVVGDLTTELVSWGTASGASTATVDDIQNLAIDGMGRVYAAEGKSTGARVWRYHQDTPGAGEIVADNLSTPSGLAVDTVGNLYVVEKGNFRIVLVTHDQQLFVWASDLDDPDFLAFTQY